MTKLKIKNVWPEILVVSITTFAVVMLAAWFFWWLPQKWQACGRLYGNILAQYVCFTSENQ